MYTYDESLTTVNNYESLLTVKYYTGWWLTHPSEKYESQLGWSFPIYGKIECMFQTTNQILFIPEWLVLNWGIHPRRKKNMRHMPYIHGEEGMFNMVNPGFVQPGWLQNAWVPANMEFYYAIGMLEDDAPKKMFKQCLCWFSFTPLTNLFNIYQSTIINHS